MTPVAAHDVGGTGHNGTFQDFVIVRISFNHFGGAGDRDKPHEGEQIDESFLNLPGVEAKLAC